MKNYQGKKSNLYFECIMSLLKVSSFQIIIEETYFNTLIFDDFKM